MYRHFIAAALLASLGLGLVITAKAQNDAATAPATPPAATTAPAPATQPAPAAGPAAAGKPESVEQRAAYAIGLNLGRQLAAQPVKLDVDMLVRGINDAVKGADAALNEEEMEQAFFAFHQLIVTRQKAVEQDYMTKNAERPGVTTTASGLQYEVITPGRGKSPAATDVVTVHYKGTLVDGTVFDSSYDRGEPATFPLDGVIRGWTEGVQLMKEGGKYRFVIPSELGYGAQGTPGGPIGPNATLIFEVELIKVGQ
jgi:FKBP-type peptidyl-prolyl cis-trans isomerase